MALSEFSSEAAKQKFVRMCNTELVKPAQNDWREVGRPSSCNAFAIATFSYLFYFSFVAF